MITFTVNPTGEKGTLDKGVFKCEEFDEVLNAAVPNVQVYYSPVPDLGLFIGVRERCPWIELTSAPEAPEATETEEGAVY